MGRCALFTAFFSIFVGFSTGRDNMSLTWMTAFPTTAVQYQSVGDLRVNVSDSVVGDYVVVLSEPSFALDFVPSRLSLFDMREGSLVAPVVNGTAVFVGFTFSSPGAVSVTLLGVQNSTARSAAVDHLDAVLLAESTLNITSSEVPEHNPPASSTPKSSDETAVILIATLSVIVVFVLAMKLRGEVGKGVQLWGGPGEVDTDEEEEEEEMSSDDDDDDDDDDSLLDGLMGTQRTQTQTTQYQGHRQFDAGNAIFSSARVPNAADSGDLGALLLSHSGDPALNGVGGGGGDARSPFTPATLTPSDSGHPKHVTMSPQNTFSLLDALQHHTPPPHTADRQGSGDDLEDLLDL